MNYRYADLEVRDPDDMQQFVHFDKNSDISDSAESLSFA